MNNIITVSLRKRLINYFTEEELGRLTATIPFLQTIDYHELGKIMLQSHNIYDKLIKFLSEYFISKIPQSNSLEVNTKSLSHGLCPLQEKWLLEYNFLCKEVGMVGFIINSESPSNKDYKYWYDSYEMCSNNIILPLFVHTLKLDCWDCYIHNSLDIFYPISIVGWVHNPPNAIIYYNLRNLGGIAKYNDGIISSIRLMKMEELVIEVNTESLVLDLTSHTSLKAVGVLLDSISMKKLTFIPPTNIKKLTLIVFGQLTEYIEEFFTELITNQLQCLLQLDELLIGRELIANKFRSIVSVIHGENILQRLNINVYG